MRPGPTEIIIIAVLIILIFGWKRLPDAARSLGRSARVFKSEVDEMKKDSEKKSDASAQTVRSESIEPTGTTDRTVPTTGSTVPTTGSTVPTTGSTVPTTDGNAVRENAPRTDNQSGPVA